MKNKLPWILLIVLVIIVIVLAMRHANTSTTTPTQTTTNTVTYACAGGSSINASFTDNSVTLKLSDGRTLTLPQQESGSGIQYQKDGVLFASKGDNAFVTENEIQTYTDCLAGTSVSMNGTKNFTDQGKTFTLTYPDTFTLSGGDIGYTQDWSVGSSTLGLVLAKIATPKNMFPKTNFGDATLRVGTSSDGAALKECLTQINGQTAKATAVTINGTDFTKLTNNDAAAGNRYDTTSYRALRNSQCYTVEYTIHYANIANFSPDQGITEFDEDAVTAKLEGIAQSFKFL